jgi:hypothetical protein
MTSKVNLPRLSKNIKQAGITMFIGMFIYYLLQNYNGKKSPDPAPTSVTEIQTADRTTATAAPAVSESLPGDQNKTVPPTQPTSEVDNFIESLALCSPQLSEKNITTPENLIQALRKSDSFKSEDIAIENFHLILKDGTERRVHVVTTDNTNSNHKKEIHLYRLDDEGYPVSLALSQNETLDSLLTMGEMKKHEMTSELKFKDGQSLNLEMHDQQVYEFQLMNGGKILSCHNRACRCS